MAAYVGRSGPPALLYFSVGPLLLAAVNSPSADPSGTQRHARPSGRGDAFPEPGCCRTSRQAGSVQSRRPPITT